SPLHVYPNPTQGIFSIEVAEAGEIFILNTLGETILHRKVKAGKHEADLSAYSKGIYYVKMKQADHITIITLIKE
ncbi:MAG: Secretion system C-terminal sorting domain, partial [Bacteroidota bacterium]